MSMSMVEEGIHKSAILLMALEEDDAAALLARLPPKYVEAVSLAIAQIDDIPGKSRKRSSKSSLEASQVP